MPAAAAVARHSVRKARILSEEEARDAIARAIRSRNESRSKREGNALGNAAQGSSGGGRMGGGGGSATAAVTAAREPTRSRASGGLVADGQHSAPAAPHHAPQATTLFGSSGPRVPARRRRARQPSRPTSCRACLRGGWEGVLPYQDAVREVYERSSTQACVACIIVANFFVSIAEKEIDPFPESLQAHRQIWATLDATFTWMFVIEVSGAWAVTLCARSVWVVSVGGQRGWSAWVVSVGGQRPRGSVGTMLCVPYSERAVLACGLRTTPPHQRSTAIQAVHPACCLSPSARVLVWVHALPARTTSHA